MDKDLTIKMYSVTMDGIDPDALARFYAALLKWVVVFSSEDYACVAPPGTAQGGYPGLTFQRNPEYKPPVWPDSPGAQQQMAHLDFAVNDVKGAVQHALECGARVADEQFSDQWTVMLDPAGHPFCLVAMNAVIESAEFGLL